MNIDKIKELFLPLSSGTRVIILVHRAKEGGHNNTKKSYLKKIITTNSEEFFNAIEELKVIKFSDPRPLRIYATVNSCDMNKAIRLFKQRQLDTDYLIEEDRNKFYLNLKNMFISCLMNNKSRETKNFLFDLDNCCYRGFIQTTKVLEKLTKIIISYPTKNGYHIVTEPFNFKNLDEDLIRARNENPLMLIDF